MGLLSAVRVGEDVLRARDLEDNNIFFWISAAALCIATTYAVCFMIDKKKHKYTKYALRHGSKK